MDMVVRDDDGEDQLDADIMVTVCLLLVPYLTIYDWLDALKRVARGSLKKILDPVGERW